MDMVELAYKQMRALVPVLEREIRDLRPRVEAARGGFLFDSFAHELGIRERGLASIRRLLASAA